MVEADAEHSPPNAQDRGRCARGEIPTRMAGRQSLEAPRASWILCCRMMWTRGTASSREAMARPFSFGASQDGSLVNSPIVGGCSYVEEVLPPRPRREGASGCTAGPTDVSGSNAETHLTIHRPLQCPET